MSTSDDDSDYSDDSFSDDDYFIGVKNHDKYVCMCKKSPEKLNSLREKKVNWEIEEERREFLLKLLPIIRNWKGPLPNLRDIFGRVIIDWLLIEYVKNNKFSKSTPLIEFIINTGYKDEPELNENGEPLLNRTTALHHAARDNFPHSNIFRALFRIYHRFDMNYVDESGLSHFHVACMYGCNEVIKEFLELGQDPSCIWEKTGATPLHLALYYNYNEVAETLLRSGTDPNLADKNGLTPLHFICSRSKDHNDPSIFLQKFFKIIDELNQLVKVDPVDKWGETPLNTAVDKDNNELIEPLLRRGADPNLADEDGFTPLHTICTKDCDDGSTKLFFKINDELNQMVQVNARDELGWTPLHLALLRGFKFVVELLLRRGADSNAVDEDGRTPLHMICNRDKDDNLYELFFKINEEINQSVKVNAVDKKGRTPLHVALGRGHKNMAESLLRRGADPNVACDGGYTPLHIIIRRWLHDFVETFFKINDELNQSVQVDAVDESGNTPLRCAVSRFWPDTVDFLLDRGAKLSSFVFPTEDHFDKFLVYRKKGAGYKLAIASRILAVVDSLEKRGYELRRSDVLTIMKLFAKRKVFDDQSANLKDDWCDDEDFAIETNEIMISPSLSLFDLIQYQPEQTTKLLTYSDYLRFVNSNKWADLPAESREPCLAYLCEIMSRGFFRRWALELFLELTRYLLPILCCDMIIKNLENKDLLAICLTDSDQACNG